MENIFCEVPGCENKRKSRGYCSGHHGQWRRGEVPAPVNPETRRGRWGRPPANLEEFFWLRVDKTDSCWLWVGKKTTLGYGQAKFQGKTTLAHRYSWELLRGPIPEGYVIDHLCHVPECVNPDHLRSTTPKGNSENRKGATRNSKTGIRGVFRYGETEKYRARVGHNGNKIDLGYFDSTEKANEAVKVMRSKLFQVSN